MGYYTYNNELYHHGIKGQKWGVRRFQNPDGTRTAAGKEREKDANSHKEINNIANKYSKLYEKWFFEQDEQKKDKYLSAIHDYEDLLDSKYDFEDWGGETYIRNRNTGHTEIFDYYTDKVKKYKEQQNKNRQEQEQKKLREIQNTPIKQINYEPKTYEEYNKQLDNIEFNALKKWNVIGPYYIKKEDWNTFIEELYGEYNKVKEPI